jgi:hypothetical protein
MNDINPVTFNKSKEGKTPRQKDPSYGVVNNFGSPIVPIIVILLWFACQKEVLCQKEFQFESCRGDIQVI